MSFHPLSILLALTVVTALILSGLFVWESGYIAVVVQVLLTVTIAIFGVLTVRGRKVNWLFIFILLSFLWIAVDIFHLLALLNLLPASLSFASSSALIGTTLSRHFTDLSNPSNISNAPNIVRSETKSRLNSRSVSTPWIGDLHQSASDSSETSSFIRLEKRGDPFTLSPVYVAPASVTINSTQASSHAIGLLILFPLLNALEICILIMGCFSACFLPISVSEFSKKRDNYAKYGERSQKTNLWKRMTAGDAANRQPRRQDALNATKRRRPPPPVGPPRTGARRRSIVRPGLQQEPRHQHGMKFQNAPESVSNLPYKAPIEDYLPSPRSPLSPPLPKPLNPPKLTIWDKIAIPFFGNTAPMNRQLPARDTLYTQMDPKSPNPYVPAGHALPPFKIDVDFPIYSDTTVPQKSKPMAPVMDLLKKLPYFGAASQESESRQTVFSAPSHHTVSMNELSITCANCRQEFGVKEAAEHTCHAGVESEASRRYVVIRNYSPHMDDEITLHIGDKIDIEETYDDGYALGTNLDNKQWGIVPLIALEHKPL